MAIAADGIKVDGNVCLRGEFSAKGEVRISTARIGGELDCNDGTFDNSGKCALYADGAHMRSRVLMRRAFVAGEVRLVGAYINGELDCSSGRFHNPGQEAISADRVHVGGTVSLREEFSARGEVRFPHARIGALECNGKFENPRDRALNASDMEVRVEVALHAQFQGEVRLVGTHIGRALIVTGTLNNPGGIALNAERTEVKKALRWLPKSGGGTVRFDFAKIGTLNDAIEAWESFDKIVLSGFTYDQFVKSTDAESRLHWLAKRSDKMQFSPQPYEQAATVLFRMGYAHDARKILLEKERLQTKCEQTNWLRKVGRRLWDVFAGYGYRLRYTAVWMAAFIAVGMVIFDFANCHRRIVPAQVIVQADSAYKHAVKSHDARPTDVAPDFFPGYAEFTPLAYSLDVFIPFFILQQEPAWFPASGYTDNMWKPSIMLVLAILVLVVFASLVESIQRRCREWRAHVCARICAFVGGLGVLVGIIIAIFFCLSNWLFSDWWWLTVWYWLEISAGWVLTSLFLLSATGLLRPRQSSGERD